MWESSQWLWKCVLLSKKEPRERMYRCAGYHDSYNKFIHKHLYITINQYLTLFHMKSQNLRHMQTANSKMLFIKEQLLLDITKYADEKRIKYWSSALHPFPFFSFYKSLLSQDG